jgi:uncharacterized protein YeaO (DUF488 family)
MAVLLKRVYLEAAPDDGARVLVDRLWPRGLKKEDVALEAWMKELAPSNELRKWFHAHPQQWEAFRKKYLTELSTETAVAGLEELYRLERKHGKLTLLYSSKNTERNNAVVLKQLIDGERKPPTGTGPAGAAAQGRTRAVRPR